MALEKDAKYYPNVAIKCFDNSELFCGTNEYLTFTYRVRAKTGDWYVFLIGGTKAVRIANFDWSYSCIGDLFNDLYDIQKDIFLKELPSYNEDADIGHIF